MRIWQPDVPEELRDLAAKVQPPHHTGDIKSAVGPIARFADVDGAIVVTKDLRVLGFGAKIAVDGAQPHVCMFKPEPGEQEIVPTPSEALGGTRHQSAAKFVERNKDSLALVISQDRRLSVAHWNQEIGMVAVVRDAQFWSDTGTGRSSPTIDLK